MKGSNSDAEDWLNEPHKLQKHYHLSKWLWKVLTNTKQTLVIPTLPHGHASLAMAQYWEPIGLLKSALNK